MIGASEQRYEIFMRPCRVPQRSRSSIGSMRSRAGFRISPGKDGDLAVANGRFRGQPPALTTERRRERDQDPAFKSFRLTSVGHVLLHPDGRGRSYPVQICLPPRGVSTFPGDLRDRILGPIDSFNAGRKTRVSSSSCNYRRRAIANQTRHILHVHVRSSSCCC